MTKKNNMKADYVLVGVKDYFASKKVTDVLEAIFITIYNIRLVSLLYISIIFCTKTLSNCL